MAKKLKAAVIGLGVGQAHCKGYSRNPDSELIAICDIDPVRLKDRGDTFGIPEDMRFIDYHDMLKLPELDVVSVALPNYLHAPVTIDALRAGKNVLCEKPIATSSIEAQCMIDEARANARTLMVCFNYRFRDDSRWLMQMKNAGKFGDIYYARAGWLRNNGIPGFGGWFTTKALSGGGPLIDLGVHMLDLTLWMMGYPEPTSVSGQAFGKFGPRGLKAGNWGSKTSGGFDVEDLAAGFIRFGNEKAMQLETSWASHVKPGRDEFFLNLYGTEGGSELKVANYTDHDTLSFYSEECGEPVLVQPNIINHASPHSLAVAHIVDCVRSGRPVEATGEQGKMLIRIIEGLYESSMTGREVRLD